ncbi:Membrane protein involved in the export of O-antigen and teichoic acid [Nitrosospira multiformis]|uniref:Membrane protein involved in the export of O-antigen and teichoic acid n=1 Tax=Nitrosospira multiformis TaxID=1231 RepID=A0A1I0A6J3_9PROT|nr:lipopolysaccharide biosynthesis protein [Nitrosospira multiformis]SES89590.1 Membrane protein involved in the export of O-antigen and teichoic acid [Nitrosospira multiformis]
MDEQQNKTEIINKILSGARWSIVFRLIAQVISWVSTIVVVRFITPDDYGLNTMLRAPLELLLLLSTLGLDLALIRTKNIEQDDLHNIFGWLLVINGLLFLAYFFGGSLIAAYFNEPGLEQLARVLAFIFLLIPFRVIPNAILDRHLNFKFKSLVELITSVSAAITTLVLAIMGAGVWALVAGTLISNMLQIILLMILQPWFIMPSLNFSAVRRMMAFGGVLVLGGTIIKVTENLAFLVVGPILGAELLGIFVAAFELALLPLSKIMAVINPIIFPAFSKFQEHRDDAAHYLGKSLGIISLGMLPVMIGTACIAPEFVPLVLGAKWSAAVTPLILLSISMPFRMTTSFLRPVINSMGRADLTVKSAITGLAVLLPLALIGANYGAIGLALAVLASELIVAFYTISICKVVFNISFMKIGQCLGPATVSSVVMAGCVLGAKYISGQQDGIEGLIIEIGVGVTSYFLTLRTFYRKRLADTIELFFRRHKSQEPSAYSSTL